MSVDDQPSIGFICPLYTEVKAVLASFDQPLPPVIIKGTKYFYGMIRHRKAVAVMLPYKEFGPIEASRCASELIKAHPSVEKDGSYCFLVGIAGGIWSQDNDIRLGDVVIATRIWDWRSGKITNKGFVSTKYPERVPSYLLRELGAFLYDRAELGAEIQNCIARMQQTGSTDKRWNHPGVEKDVLYNVDYHHLGADTCDDCDPEKTQWRPRRSTTNPMVHDGLVASGNTVLKESTNRGQLQQANALAVEMEACGMPENFIVIRGISDYADSHKNDIWQPYAAATAAACARLMVDRLDGIMDSQDFTKSLGDSSYFTPWIPNPRIEKLEVLTSSVNTVTFSPNGSLLATGHDDKTIRLWGTRAGQEVKMLKGHSYPVTGVAFSPDGSLLASASGDRTVRLWNPTTGQQMKVLKGHGHPTQTAAIYSVVRTVIFSHDGLLLASASHDQTVRLWSPGTGEELHTLRGHTGYVFAVAFSHDMSLLASGSSDNTVRLWDLKTAKEVKVLEGHTTWVHAVAFSPDDSLLASASDDRTVRLWNPKTGQEVKILKGHCDGVTGLVFSPDGSLLASISRDKTVRLWNPMTGKELQTLNGHTDTVRAVAFSGDGSLLASGSNDKTVRLWKRSSD